MLTIDQIVTAILNGEVDDDFKVIYDTLRTRQQAVAKIRASLIKEGVRVELINVRPKYLTGLTGSVKSRNSNGTFDVALDPICRASAGRYATSEGVIKCKPVILEVIG